MMRVTMIVMMMTRITMIVMMMAVIDEKSNKDNEIALQNQR